VTVLFQGAGTRWIGELTKADHPAHELFEAIKEPLLGCPVVVLMCLVPKAIKSGFELIKDNPVPVLLDYPALASSLRMATRF